MATRTLLETLLLSDFGRLQPERVREIAAAQQHPILRGKPNGSLPHRVGEKQTTSPAVP